MKIRKKLQASVFSFIVLNLAEKAVLHFVLIILRYIKSALRKKQLILPTQSTFKENRGNIKNISFQLHYGKLSRQKYFTRSYYYRCVTGGRREGGGEISPALSRKTGKNFPDFEKKCPDCGHLMVKFLI